MKMTVLVPFPGVSMFRLSCLAIIILQASGRTTWPVDCSGVMPQMIPLISSRAPSWSWASVDGTILAVGRQLVMRDEAILVKVLDAQPRLATADPAGQVVDGIVALAGMLFEVNFKERQSGEPSPAGILKPKISSATASNIAALVYPDSGLRGVFTERIFF